MHLGLHYAVILPLLSILALAASLVNLAIRDRDGHVRLLRIGIALILVGWIVYTIPFLVLDYRLAEVARNSSNGLSPLIRWAVSWSGGGSSLYFFATVTAAASLYLMRREAPISFTASAAVVILVIMVAASLNGAFDVMASGGGLGINPLLKSYWIVPHPLTTFGGYSLLLVASLALLAGMRIGLILLLAGWSLLSLGITFGAYWSYETFGWGGYWAWDPVEISELVVWLAAVASIHSIGPLAGLRKPMLLLTASSVPLALYVTRSGLSPLHSFAAANIGSITLLSLSIGFLGLMLYYIAVDEEVYNVVGSVRRTISTRRLVDTVLVLAGVPLVVIALFVYSSLLAPSLLTAVGIEATVPTMSEGVRFYHPVLYPLFLVALVAVPGYFLFRDIGGRGFIVYSILVTGIAVLSGVAAYTGAIRLALMAGVQTNLMMTVGVAVSLFVLGALLASLITPVLRGRTRIVRRDLVLKVIHIGMVITFIGVLLSGTYAFNDIYFKTYSVSVGDTIEIIDGVKLTLIDYKYERGSGDIDLYTHVSGKRMTAFLAWQGLNLLKNDLAPAVRDVLLATKEVESNKTINALKMILTGNNSFNLGNSLSINSEGKIVLNNIISNINKIIINNNVSMIIVDPNITIGMKPIVSDTGELKEAWLDVRIYGARAFITDNITDAGDNITAGAHSYYLIEFNEPVTIEASNMRLYIKEAIMYPEIPQGKKTEEYGRFVDDRIELYSPILLITKGIIEYDGVALEIPGSYDRGVYLYIVMERGEAVVLEEALQSSLSQVLSDTEIMLKLTSSKPGVIPLPQEALESVRLEVKLNVEGDGWSDTRESVIRFEANGEAIGIHGLVTDTIIIKRGLSDIYINIQPPQLEGHFNSYHELLVYYLSEARRGLDPAEYLSLVAIMSAGYNIGGVGGSGDTRAGSQVEQGIIDLYLLAEKFDPENSAIVERGITVMVKVVPGVNLIWIGVAVMVVGGIASALIYLRLVKGHR